MLFTPICIAVIPHYVVNVHELCAGCQALGPSCTPCLSRTYVFFIEVVYNLRLTNSRERRNLDLRNLGRSSGLVLDCYFGALGSSHRCAHSNVLTVEFWFWGSWGSWGSWPCLFLNISRLAGSPPIETICSRMSFNGSEGPLFPSLVARSLRGRPHEQS